MSVASPAKADWQRFNSVARPAADWFNYATKLNWSRAMLKYAVVFALISLIAAVFGFSGVAVGSAAIAKILFGFFLILAFVFVVLAALGVGTIKRF
jgi:uncharacterized membrane protein YtjA (UPF0391 family)